MNMVIFMIELKGKKVLKKCGAANTCQVSRQAPQIKGTTLTSRVLTLCTLSRHGPTGIWWLAASRRNSKSPLRLFLRQTLRTRATRASSTPSNTTSNHGAKTPPLWDQPRSQVRAHPRPQRASQSSVHRIGPTTTPATGRFPSLLLPCHLQPSSLSHCTSPSAGSSPEGATCLTLAGFKGSCRQAGTADTQGWGSSEEEWAESRPHYMFSDYKISVFLFKVLSVNIPYYKSSTTVSTDCQY